VDEDISDEEALELALSEMFDQEEKAERIRELLDRIPPREADIIELYFDKKKRQADIAAIFNITQAAVSYRLGRGILRIQFLLDLPDITRDQMIEGLSKIFPISPVLPDLLEEDPEAYLHIDTRILISMWETTCQSEVAKTLDLTQGRVRHRFFKAVDLLRESAEEDESLEPYSEIFTKISSKKFNILREVKLPQWADRGINELI
jgi:DNA-directed RNA polymerase specialized sigma24 family protein